MSHGMTAPDSEKKEKKLIARHDSVFCNSPGLKINIACEYLLDKIVGFEVRRASSDSLLWHRRPAAPLQEFITMLNGTTAHVQG